MKQQMRRLLKRDEIAFKKARKNYRNKISRIRRKTGFELSPDFIDDALGIEMPSLKDVQSGEALTTRKEFNNFIKKLEEINSRNFDDLKTVTNSKGLTYPKIMNKVGKEKTRQAKDLVRKKREELVGKPLYVDGEEIGTIEQRELMRGNDQYGLYEPNDFDPENFSSPKAMEHNIEQNTKRGTEEYYDERMVQMQENFVSIFDGGEHEALQERLKALTPSEFYNLYLQFPDMAFEEWDSDTGGHIVGDKDPETVILSILDAYERGEIDTSLKDIGN